MSSRESNKDEERVKGSERERVCVRAAESVRVCGFFVPLLHHRWFKEFRSGKRFLICFHPNTSLSFRWSSKTAATPVATTAAAAATPAAMTPATTLITTTMIPATATSIAAVVVGVSLLVVEATATTATTTHHTKVIGASPNQVRWENARAKNEEEKERRCVLLTEGERENGERV